MFGALNITLIFRTLHLITKSLTPSTEAKYFGGAFCVSLQKPRHSTESYGATC